MLRKRMRYYIYSCELQKNHPIDFYMLDMGDTPLEMKIDEKAKYINLGDWISHTYAKIKQPN